LIFFTLSFATVMAADPPGVETLMTREDFSAAGLEKLTEAEREHLSEWIARYREGVTVGPAPPKTSKERAKEKEIEITVKVIPAFRGWSGKTVFRLDNGQVWLQRQRGTLRYSGDDSAVTLYQNIMGKYMLKHADTGRAIGVKRIQ
jgi:hypothetical protein